MATELGVKLGMSSFMAPIYSNDPSTPGGQRAEYGVAVLSKYRIVSATNHQLTRLSTQSSDPVPTPMPGFAEVVVDVAGVGVHVYSTHLDYRADPAVRAIQTRETVQILERTSGPKILMGDMNAEPSAPELAPLYTSLRDVWRAGHGAGLSYPSTTPEKRIDQILVSRAVTPLVSWVPNSQGSDHRPVVSLLLIRA